MLVTRRRSIRDVPALTLVLRQCRGVLTLLATRNVIVTNIPRKLFAQKNLCMLCAIYTNICFPQKNPNNTICSFKSKILFNIHIGLIISLIFQNIYSSFRKYFILAIVKNKKKLNNILFKKHNTIFTIFAKKEKSKLAYTH